MILRKHPLWRKELLAFVEESRNRTFDRGTFDCVRFSTEAVRRMTDINVQHELMSSYGDDLEAVRLMKQLGPQGFQDAIATTLERLDCPEVPVTKVQFGDILFFDQGEAHMGISICLGQMAVSPGPTGLAFTRAFEAKRAWRIP